MKRPPREAIGSDQECRAFYEEVGARFPEAETVYHDYKGMTRFEVVLDVLQPFAKKGIKALDIGCSEGTYTIPYVQAGGIAHGIDVSSELIEVAKQNAHAQLGQTEFITFEVGDALDLGRHKHKYDMVLFSEVLEHLNNPNQALRQIADILRPGSHLILTAPTPLFEIYPAPTFDYLHQFLSGRLKEEQLIDSSATRLSSCGVSRTIYRHDGFYPLALRRFVTSFGFRCIKMMTCTPYYPAERTVVAQLFRTLARPRVRRLVMRVPFLNLFSQTNVQLFRRIESSG